MKLVLPNLLKLSKRPTFRAALSLNIAARLHLGFAIVLLLMLTLGMLGWYYTGALASASERIVDRDYHRAELANKMQHAVSDMALAVASLSLTEDPEDVNYELKRLQLAFHQYDESAKVLEATIATAPDAASWTELIASVKVARDDCVNLLDQISRRAKDGTAREALADFTATQVRPPQDQWFATLDKLLKRVNESMHAASAASRDTAQRVRAIMVAAAMAALAAGLLAAWLISRSISRPLAQAVGVARRVADGDLSASLATDRSDEIGELLLALSDMQSSLRHMVGDMRMAADSVRHASSEVAAGNTDLSQRTELTASHLQHASSSMQDLTGSVHQSTQSAASADVLATRAAQAATRGGAVMHQVVGNMEAIATSSRKIADITSVIDGIAFQTNILALNAAVEAARAGEQGRGFAVVATEVRNLAQRAASAAKEIKSLINASVERVESGSKLVQGAGVTMGEIVQAVERVASVISEIRVASGRQSAGIEDVNAIVVQVDAMTAQNAALVEQSAAAADMLSEQAVRLNVLIGSFRLPERQALAEAA